LTATGVRFLGIPYLWGGSTPKGFDCSGLVQRIYRLHGVILPRDSDQQSRIGGEKHVASLDDLAPGDLLFFGRAAQRITHVGMALPDRLFLHAYGQVRVNSLDPAHPLFEPNLARDWRLTRDPLARAAQKA
jgi:cell wall-associated NlpC family hydrolase